MVFGAPLRIWRSPMSTPLMRVTRRERHEGRAERAQVALAQIEALLGEHDDAAALGGLVGERGELRGVGELLLGHAGRRQELRGLPIAERDGAGLVEEQHVDVAGRLDGAARGRDDVRLHHPAHAGHADRRQQAADRGGNEAHQQRDQRGERHRSSRLADLDREQRERQQRHDDDQEHQRQRHQQDGQRDLVGGLLPLGGLDHRDHAVEKRFSRIDRSRAPRSSPTAPGCRRSPRRSRRPIRE